MLFEVDADGRYLSVHSPKTEFLAAPLGKFLGNTIPEVMPAAVAHVCMDALHEAQLNGASKGKQFELEVNQKTYWFELSVARKEADSETGSSVSFIVLSRDITERKLADEKINRLAFYDSLTGLANRHAFLERVERELRRARHKNTRFGVLFMDLDGFKHINDTLGHDVGDLALQWCADNLRESVRAADVLARAVGSTTNIELARLGGDEFTALILDIHRPEDALQVANRILELMRRPFVVGDQQVRLTSSIGIAFYPEDGDDAHSLLKHADSAMYLAKESGRNQSRFYSADLTQKAVNRMTLESDLRQALDQQEFVLHYQAQF
jgi:diguanylate cyclase (GGDEF)-like protein